MNRFLFENVMAAYDHMVNRVVAGLVIAGVAAAGAAYAQAPNVTNRIPERGSVGVARSADIQVEFDQSMDGSTFTSNRCFAYSSLAGSRKGEVTFNALTNQATLSFSASFLPGERVHVDLAQGIMNAAGADELAPYSWSFVAKADRAFGMLGDNGQSFGLTSVYGITLADLDRDGVLELITGDLSAYSEIYTNDGSGMFYAGGQQLGHNRDVAVGDLNGDGWPDLFCGGTSSSRVYTNDGTGVFNSTGQSIANNWNERVLLADFDGDGDIDAFALNNYDYGKIWTNDGTGWFGDTGQRISTNLKRGAVGDLDNDGDLDVVISSITGGVNVYTNDGHGVFGTVGQQLISSGSYESDIGDANGDGCLDILVARYGGDSRVFTNDGTGAFYETGQTLYGHNITAGRFGDMNGDDLLDVVLYGISFGKYIYTNNGAAMFYEHQHVSGGTGDGTICLGDVDGDNDLDLAFSCISAPGVNVYFNEYPDIMLLDANGTEIADSAPASLANGTDFDQWPVGASFTNMFYLTNSAGVALSISEATVTGDGAAAFSVIDMPSVVDGKTRSAFGVRFAPLATGVVTAQVTIVNNSTNAAYVMNVQGAGIAPTVTNTVPANAQDNVLTADIRAEFDAPMKPSTLTTNTYRLYSGQSGFLPGSVSLGHDAWNAAFSPGQGFRPGERIYAQITHGVSNAAGSVELVPYGWMFYAMAAGSGSMTDSGQAPGTRDTRCATLGDLDGDGDLDALLVNFGQADEIWTNDGSGVFFDSGQRLGSHAGCYGALGDLDDDGDLDLFIANLNQKNTVWFNNGSGMFSDSGQSLGTTYSLCISLGDVDADGDLDAYDTVQGAGDILWLNDGSGTFTDSGQSLSTAEGRGAMLGDVDNDGDLDVCIAVRVAGDEVWLNNGSGVFSNSGQALGAGPSRDVALGDFNSDGFLDLFIAEDNAAGNTVWTNDGSGVFCDTGQSLGTNDSVAVELADMDGDGDLDACVANNGQPDAYWQNNGAGTFSLEGETTNAVASWHAGLGDVNGDGSVDTMVAVSGGSFYLLYGDVPDLFVLGEDGAVIDNNAEPSLLAGTDYGPVNQGYSKTLTLVFTNAGNGELNVQSVYNMRPDCFTVETTVPFDLLPDECTNVAIRFDADVPGVHSALVFFVSNSSNSPYWLNLVAECVPPGVTNTIPAANERHVDNDTYVIAQFNTNMMVSTLTSNTFFLYGEQSGYHRGGIGTAYSGMEAILAPDTELLPGERVFGELTRGITNAAGTFDMAYHTWCFNVKTATGGGAMYAHQHVTSLGNTPNTAPLGDLNDDGWLDAVASAVYSGYKYVLLNDGSGSLITNQTFARWDYANDVVLGDLDNDGALDLFMVCDEARGDLVWTNDGTGRFKKSNQLLGTNDNRAAALGDLDGDGDLDAFVVTENTKGNSVWLNNGLGVFTDSGQRFYGGQAYDVILADVDGDGDLDAYEMTRAADRVWLNDGQAVFSDSGQRLGDHYGHSADCGDINGDGYIDFIAACGWDYFVIWLNDGQGTFTNSGQTLGAQYATGVALGDLDGDGDLDAVTVYLNNTASRIWYNDGQGVFSDSGQRLDQNDWRVSAGDFNNDQRLDLYMSGYSSAGQLWTNYAEVYAIQATCGPHGSITPAGMVEVVVSQSISFVVSADAYWRIGTLTTNGVDVAEAAGVTLFTSRWVEVTQTGTIHAAISEDTAAEGTPLWWLASYGLTNGGASFDQAEVADVDTDEFDAADEYIADTNPNDSNSFFQVTAVSNTASCELFFHSSSNRNYSLFYNDQLTTALWSGVEGQTNQPGAGGADSLIDTNDAGARSYRLSVELP